MLNYLANRLVQFAIVLLTIMIVVFVCVQVVADPALLALPPGATQSEIDEFNALYGFDRPFLEQLFTFLWGAVRLDFGTSIWLGTDALGAVMARLPLTLMLAIPAVTIALVLGVLVGGIAARRAGSIFDKSVQGFAHFSNAIADFWLAIMLILIFSLWTRLLPPGGVEPLPATMVMPIIVLALTPFARFVIVARAGMLTEHSRPYVTTARAKGVSEAGITWRHVVQNASIPILTLYFFELGRIFVGAAIIVETVYAWPGIGSMIVEALRRGDVFLIEALVVVAAAAIVLLNLIADLLYFALDPRTRSVSQGAFA
ncbi:MAG: ABC transporter permease [Mycetocola sp.]